MGFDAGLLGWYRGLEYFDKWHWVKVTGKPFEQYTPENLRAALESWLGRHWQGNRKTYGMPPDLQAAPDWRMWSDFRRCEGTESRSAHGFVVPVNDARTANDSPDNLDR